MKREIVMVFESESRTHRFRARRVFAYVASVIMILVIFQVAAVPGSA